MVDVKPYVSYAREAGNLPPAGQALKAHFEANGQQLIYDDAPESGEGVERYEAIEGFIHRLTTSPLAVFLLSENYFRSVWCLRELTRFIRAHKAPQYHGIFVSIGGWPEDVEKFDDYLLGTYQRTQLDYWRDFGTKYPAHKERADEIIELLPATLEFLASLPIRALDGPTPPTGADEPTEIERVYQDATRYAERMQFVVDVPGDEDYRLACEFALSDFLRQHADVATEFVSALRSRQATESQVARVLMQLDGSTRLRQSRRALRQYMRRRSLEVEEMRERLSELVALLLLSVFRNDLTPHLREAHDEPSLLVIADPRDTEVAFVLSARTHENPVGDMELRDGRLMSRGRYPTVTSEAARGDIVDAQIKLIWQSELPHEDVPADRTEMIGRLRHQMESNREEGLPRFLLVEKDSAINHRSTLDRLKFELPLLLVIELGIESGRAGAIQPLCPELDGANIRDEVERFAKTLMPDG
ncbi:MAG: toll/interleukin-1 receptor domain-containing protein [Pseudomonadota bacterium]